MNGQGNLDDILKKMQTEMALGLEDDDESTEQIRYQQRMADDETRRSGAQADEAFRSGVAQALTMLAQQMAELSQMVQATHMQLTRSSEFVNQNFAAIDRGLMSISQTMAAPKEIVRNAEGRPVGVRIKQRPM
jgi:hypothetical protein